MPEQAAPHSTTALGEVSSEQITEPTRRRLPSLAVQVIGFVVLIALFVALWEAWKALGEATSYKIFFPNTFFTAFGQEIKLRPVPNDINMPHIWAILKSFFELPARASEEILLTLLIKGTLVTLREAIVGFVLGGVLGFTLGVVFAHSDLLERGLMPYVVASQTIPILAVAPIVVLWLKAGWWSVAIISAYLTFFPVTINTLRGLRSPDPTAIELLRSYAASNWQILWKLRFPSALPYLFTAFKVSITTSLVGAIIGELPAGTQGGLGWLIKNFTYSYLQGPQRLFATNIALTVVGIALFLIVLGVESFALRHRSNIQVS
jgi:NitT/TauT family transport system permease protein